MTLDDKGVIVRCSQCGSRNRISYAAIGNEIRCGQCKTPLPQINAPLVADSAAHFNELTTHSALPVLVDFWAAWCGPCKMVAPELEKVAGMAAGKAVVAKLNTEDVPEIAAQYRISSIPTMALVQNGRELGRISGARPAADILAFVRSQTSGSR